MDITPLVPADRQLIHGYGDFGFTVSGTRWEGSIIVFPSRTVAWTVAALGELTMDSLAPIWQAETRPEIMVLGCGARMANLPKDVRSGLRAAGIVVEPMDTGAACRTYNVLLTEERRVAAALIAV